MTRKPTIEAVATLAGVSVATADRVLNRRGGVRPEKESRVIAAARELDLDRRLGRVYAHRLRVAVLIQPAVNPFHAALGGAFATANRAYADLALQFLLHLIDPNEPDRIAALIDRVARQHQGLIVTSPATPAVAAALRRAAATIPVVTLATDIPDSGRHAYVGSDDEQAGRVAGEIMGRLLGPRGGPVLVIVGLLSLTGHRARENGFRAVLGRNFPTATVVAVDESQEDAHRAGLLVEGALRTWPSLRGVYLATAGPDDVVAALAGADVFFVTHELTADRRRLLQARSLHAVVDQDASGEVQGAALTMARLLGRAEGNPATTLTPVRIHMAENC